MTTIPEKTRIRLEARELLAKLTCTDYVCTFEHGCGCFDALTSALLAAEKRGKEEEREDAARKAVTRLAELQASYSDAMQVAAAIRSTN